MNKEMKIALAAARDKKAEDIVGLNVKDVCSFTDCFLMCTGNNQRHVQAISDEVEMRLSKAGTRAHHIEGYSQAEWVLMDYVDFVVHVFSPRARTFYDLERLWRTAKKIRLPEDKPAATGSDEKRKA